jgi:hypothetical protein
MKCKQGESNPLGARRKKIRTITSTERPNDENILALLSVEVDVLFSPQPIGSEHENRDLQHL